VLRPHLVDVFHEQGPDRCRQHRGSIFTALAIANHDMARHEVDVFHTQPAALQQAETSAVEQ
jgi:hypothetical protein